MKRILHAVLIVLAVFFTASCRISRDFYVDVVDLHIHVEELMRGKYRVFIYKSDGQMGEDYIDMSYNFSEMPSIRLSIPLDGSNDVHVLGTLSGGIKDIQSKNFNIIYPRYNHSDIAEVNKFIAWRDSVMFDIPSITIQVDSNLRSVTFWDEDGESSRTVHPSRKDPS